MGYSPLTLSKALRTPLGTALAALSVIVLVYSVFIRARILAGVLFVALVALGFIAYRLLAAVEAVADGHQRLADAREREAFTRSSGAPDSSIDEDAADEDARA
ncbi:hypothetical protein [Haloparvum sedimenti]|uniref:hypothetical protein n=1 Tax=Haloparvum sedimenti TaxID=1678448 RepID=UPI00071E7FF4|nr:hypothetical protein [Haloparvum sedimenti]